MGDWQYAGSNWQQQREKQQQEAAELGGGRGRSEHQETETINERGTKHQETETVRIIYTNAQSILGKLNELAAYAVDEKPDFILLTESWCNQSINDANLSIPGYQLEPELRRDRDDTLNGLGGGLLVYSRNGLKILPFKLQEDNGFHQHVCFKIITRGEPINIILAYRPPSSTKENFDKLLDLMRKMPRNTILIGDINVPGIDWSRNHATGARGRELLTVVQEEYLEQLVLFPTHDKGNILDLLITNMASSIILVNDNGKLGRSDHCIIATELKVSKMVRKGQNKNPNWTKADYPGLRAYMAGKDWDAMFTGKTTEQAWKILKEEINIAS